MASTVLSYLFLSYLIYILIGYFCATNDFIFGDIFWSDYKLKAIFENYYGSFI